MVLGGGQDASAVTTTDHRAGKFEAKFFDKVDIFLIDYFVFHKKLWLWNFINFLCYNVACVDSPRRNWRC